MRLPAGGRHLAADMIAFLAGLVTLLAMMQTLQPASDSCADSSVTVWSSIEPGKASETDSTGVVQQAAADVPCVRVVAKGSGLAAAALESSGWSERQGEPDAWLPTDSLWARRLGARAKIRARPLGSVASSRMQVVVGKSLVADLGWTRRSHVSWSDLQAAARAGRLRVVKENAINSTSGAMATLLAYEAAAGGRLTPGVVASGQLDAATSPVERAVVEYPGEITQFLRSLETGRTTSRGVNLMILQRALYRQYDFHGQFEEFALSGPDPVVDHPFLLRPGLSRARARTAQRFYDELVGPGRQRALQARGFDPRPGTPSRSKPSGAVVDAVLTRWRDHLRRRVRLAILLDQSGSVSSLSPTLSGTLRTALSRLSPDPPNGFLWSVPSVLGLDLVGF
jgi:hypothetical protein